jgi:hypothetical protein
MPVLNASAVTAPGTYISENTAGLIPASTATFDRCYIIGTGSTGPFNTPTQVVSADDFTNQFGSSPSTNSIKLFFNNLANGILFFVRATAKQIGSITIATPTAGAYSVTINGTAISYTAPASPTLQGIIDGLINAINSNSTVNAVVVAQDNTTGDGVFTITARNAGTAFTLTGGTAPAGSTIALTADTLPGLADDYVYAIQNSFDPDVHAQGFLIAPEAFATLTSQSDRTSVATAMENQAATEGFDWIALVDSGPASGTGATDTSAKANTEGQFYTTARGHLAYFFPYVIDLNDNVVPPSAGVAAIALWRYQNEGFAQPPAGAKYPMRGVKDVTVRLTKAQQAVSNPLGINYIRKLPNLGVVVWGARTRSSSPYFRFVNTRIILNVLIGTLRGAFDSVIFTAVDGQGVLFTRIRETAAAICYQFWDGGALFGQTPVEGFEVVCDRTNNPALDLENGIVRFDVYAAPSPTLERLLGRVNRVAIGQVQIAADQPV